MILGHCFGRYEKENKKEARNPSFFLVKRSNTVVGKMDYTTNQFKVARTEIKTKNYQSEAPGLFLRL